MKQFLKPAYLPFIVLFTGIVTFSLRLCLFSLGRDQWGLLPEGTIPDILSLVFVAITLALIGLGVWNLREEKEYNQNFPASTIPALGMALAAISFAFSSIMGFFSQQNSLISLGNALGLLAAAALLVLAWFRYQGKQPNMLLHSLVCIYLMVYLISHYQLWSGFPQLQSYAFELLAIVFAMLACYQRAAFDTASGDRRMYSFFSLATLFFSLAALPSCDDPVFFLGCAVWMFFTPCRMTLPEPKEN